MGWLIARRHPYLVLGAELIGVVLHVANVDEAPVPREVSGDSFEDIVHERRARLVVRCDEAPESRDPPLVLHSSPRQHSQDFGWT